jgi:hypothetical protein
MRPRCSHCGIEISYGAGKCKDHCNKGNPHDECVEIDEAFMHRVYDARDERNTTFVEIDALIGKGNTRYLHSTFNRLRLYGKSAMHKEQHEKLIQWLKDNSPTDEQRT